MTTLGEPDGTGPDGTGPDGTGPDGIGPEGADATRQLSAVPGPGGWVVEVAVHPAWYADQDSPHDLPEPGVPRLVPVATGPVLVGRPAADGSYRPEVDCSPDTSVSRRQARLTFDGSSWWLEDLGSANGTFVGTVDGPLPTEPLPPGRSVDLGEDDCVFVGAWTRLRVVPAGDTAA